MKKNNTSFVKMPHKRANYQRKQQSFSVDRLNSESEDVIKLFKLIQAVRICRIKKQEEYNSYRHKLINDRMLLEADVIATKKKYGKKILALNEEYNSMKANDERDLKDLRKQLVSAS